MKPIRRQKGLFTDDSKQRRDWMDSLPSVPTGMGELAMPKACFWRLPSGLHQSMLQIVEGLFPRKRVLQGVALASAAAMAIAGTVVHAYHERDDQQWTRMLQVGRMVPVRSADGALLGGVALDESATAASLQRDGFLDTAHLSYPDKFTAMLIALEDVHHNTWREICGIDVVGLPLAWFSGRGGSTLAMQITKQVLGTGQEKGFDLLVRKFKEVGYAAKLSCMLSPNEIVKMYVERVPLIAWGGTTRGLLASADVAFGKPVDQLSHAEMAVLAAAALFQLKDASELLATLRQTGCAIVPVNFAAAMQAGFNDASWRHCRLILRAKTALQRTLSGVDLAQAIHELAGMERGIAFKNPWAPIGTQRVANISARGQALLPAPVMRALRDVVDGNDLPPSGLVVTLSEDHVRFKLGAANALSEIERASRTDLCSKLTLKGVISPCPQTPGAKLADTVLLKANVFSGEVSRMYTTFPDSLTRATRLGSVAKLIAAHAAVKAGFTADSRVCPRRAVVDGRVLLRVTRPREGYVRCASGEAISLTEAFMQSDSLAIYDLNRQLGEAALKESATALGLPLADRQKAGSMAHQVAFGTFAASPMQALQMGQKLASAAFQWPVMSGPLKLVRTTHGARKEVALGLSPSQALHLKRLLVAPLSEDGTLEWANEFAVAGKSGTTSASTRPSQHARPYVAGKLTLLVSANGEVTLTAISQPDPPHALSIESLAGGVFKPLVATLFTDYPISKKP
jgi:Transglycosylase/Penicillin binding protein transpeptidase domain